MPPACDGGSSRPERNRERFTLQFAWQRFMPPSIVGAVVLIDSDIGISCGNYLAAGGHHALNRRRRITVHGLRIKSRDLKLRVFIKTGVDPKTKLSQREQRPAYSYEEDEDSHETPHDFRPPRRSHFQR